MSFRFISVKCGTKYASAIERVADKVRLLAPVKPALVRLLEWQLDEELERTKTGTRESKAGIRAGPCPLLTVGSASPNPLWGCPSM